MLVGIFGSKRLFSWKLWKRKKKYLITESSFKNQSFISVSPANLRVSFTEYNWAFIMALASDAQLFEESFKVESLSDPKYDRVDRIFCTSLDGHTKMSLDINNELFPCRVGETLHAVLATSLALDGSKDDEKGWRDVTKMGGNDATLADMFEYVCHGKIYKFEDAEKDGNM